MMHQLSELDENLWKPLTIPGRSETIHRGTDHVATVRMLRADIEQSSANLLKHWVDAMSGCVGAFDAGEEVGDARNNADR